MEGDARPRIVIPSAATIARITQPQTPDLMGVLTPRKPVYRRQPRAVKVGGHVVPVLRR